MVDGQIPKRVLIEQFKKCRRILKTKKRNLLRIAKSSLNDDDYKHFLDFIKYLEKGKFK